MRSTFVFLALLYGCSGPAESPASSPDASNDSAHALADSAAPPDRPGAADAASPDTRPGVPIPTREADDCDREIADLVPLTCTPPSTLTTFEWKAFDEPKSVSLPSVYTFPLRVGSAGCGTLLLATTKCGLRIASVIVDNATTTILPGDQRACVERSGHHVCVAKLTEPRFETTVNVFADCWGWSGGFTGTVSGSTVTVGGGFDTSFEGCR